MLEIENGSKINKSIYRLKIIDCRVETVLDALKQILALQFWR